MNQSAGQAHTQVNIRLNTFRDYPRPWNGARVGPTSCRFRAPGSEFRGKRGSSQAAVVKKSNQNGFALTTTILSLFTDARAQRYRKKVENLRLGREEDTVLCLWGHSDGVGWEYNTEGKGYPR